MQKLLTNLRSHRKQNLLSYRLLVYILMCSTMLAILSTAVQLFWDYRNDIGNIEKGIQSIEAAKHIDPVYTETLNNVLDEGVEVMGFGCSISPNEITITQPIPFIRP